MHLAKQQHADHSFGESQFTAAGAVGNDIAIEDEQRPETSGDQARSNARDREIQMQQHQSAQRLARVDNEDDDDSNDNVTVRVLFLSFFLFCVAKANIEYRSIAYFQFPAASNGGGASSRVIVVGWDSFRSRLILFLIACLIVWACIFFPLLDT